MKKLYNYRNREFRLTNGTTLKLDTIGLPIHIEPGLGRWLLFYGEDTKEVPVASFRDILKEACEYLIGIELELAKRNKFVDGLKDLE